MAVSTAPGIEHRLGARTPRPAPPSSPQPRRRVREEIQALRALAVALVVVHHLWPGALPGGYVGVDVFFAISGFLITGLLVDELERRGRISLTGFWARRARRLLPAALLTVLGCALATVALVPLTEWRAFFDAMLAGVLYVENWHLAAQAVDYFAPDTPSPVQHFWTLSVEEQFYVAWPLLLLAGALVSRRRAALAAVLGLVTVASLTYGIGATAADPATAFFSTPARAWEFGLGGLLALLPAWGGHRHARAVLSWLGLAAIVAAAVAFHAGTPFPGLAALLPVLGALAVIRAGMPARAGAPTKLFAVAPVQRLGDLSYGVYLWHWPLLILAPYALGRTVGAATAFAIAALSVALAAVSKAFVEDPVRAGPLLTRRRPRVTFAAAAAAMAAVCAVAVAAQAHLDARVDRDRQAVADAIARASGCFGAPAAIREGCAGRIPDDVVAPSPVVAQRQGNAPCSMVERRSRLAVCAFGVGPERARATVAVVGDSHAAHWRAALAPVARAERWRALSLTRTGCPFSRAPRDVDEPARTNCLQWNREVLGWLRAHPEVTTVFVAARAGADVERGTPAEGYAAAWRALPPTVRRVVVLRDTPRLRFATLGCVERALASDRAGGDACAVVRRRALQPDPQVTAARAVPRARVVDLSEVFCDRRVCRPVIGGALAYRDEDHLTPTFARTLAPLLQREVRRALRRG
ncbi:MAG TPA: acyltransferase family protein [Baekduia sp.]|nr:acyltransferase family protein [Baekduia sp.]